MSFSLCVTLAYFTLISYLICGMVGEIWKDASTFGRQLDRVHLYLGIVYSGISLSVAGFTILLWLFGRGAVSTPIIFSWGWCGIGVYLIGFLLITGVRYRDVRLERLILNGWTSYNQLSDIEQMPSHIGWTFGDLPKILEYPELQTETYAEIAGEDEDEVMDPLFEDRDVGDGDGLVELLRIIRTFMFRNLFRIIFAGFLVSFDIVRSAAEGSSSQTEAYLNGLRDKEAVSFE